MDPDDRHGKRWAHCRPERAMMCPDTQQRCEYCYPCPAAFAPLPLSASMVEVEVCVPLHKLHLAASVWSTTSARYQVA